MLNNTIKYQIAIFIITLSAISCQKETTIVYGISQSNNDPLLDGLWKQDNDNYYLFNNNKKLVYLYSTTGQKKEIDSFPFFIENQTIQSTLFNNHYRIVKDTLFIQKTMWFESTYTRSDLKEIEKW